MDPWQAVEPVVLSPRVYSPGPCGWVFPTFIYRFSRNQQWRFAVLPVNYVMQKGKSNWLEGIILICKLISVWLVINGGADQSVVRHVPHFWSDILVLSWCVPCRLPCCGESNHDVT